MKNGRPRQRILITCEKAGTCGSTYGAAPTDLVATLEEAGVFDVGKGEEMKFVRIRAAAI